MRVTNGGVLCCKPFRCIPCLASVMQSETSLISIFLSLTGCDTTSFFARRSKRTAWTMWSKLTDVSLALYKLAQTPATANIEEIIPELEGFIVLVYDLESSDDSVNKGRKTLFL